MSKKVRQFGVEEKLRIIEEARAPGATVAEVLRRHQIDEGHLLSVGETGEGGDARGRSAESGGVRERRSGRSSGSEPRSIRRAGSLPKWLKRTWG